jgi:tryptophan-rich sensory protein
MSVLAIIAYAWPSSKLAAILLVPYAAWTAFATYLTWAIYRLNTAA